MGVDAPFSQIPRHGALLIGVIIAPLMDRSRKFDDKLEIFSTAAGDKGVLSMVMIFLLAGAFAGVAKTIVPLTEVVSFYPPQLPLGGGTSLGSALRELSHQIDTQVRKTTLE